jgi:hypothetical protein
MKNLVLNPHNVYEEKSKEFLNSKLADRLREKYRAKPFEEEYKPLYYVALIVSYLCNGFSILTASTYVFSYLLSIFLEIPSPNLLAGAVTFLVLVLVEALQRFLSPKLFKNGLQYGFKLSLFSLLLVIAAISTLSILASYNGGFDVVKVVSSPPIYSAPSLYDIEEAKQDFNKMIAEAGAGAETYKKTRLYLGRLSNVDGREYKKLLSVKTDLQNKKLAKISSLEAFNREKVEKAELKHLEELREYSSSIESKGGGLAGVAIAAQLIFFLAIFFLEYYDYKTSTQYAIIETVSPPLPPEQKEVGFKSYQQSNNNYENGAYNRTQIGFNNSSKGITHQQPKKLLEQNNTTPTTITKTVYQRDKKTIKHTDKKTGKTKYYTLSQVNNFIKVYEGRVAETLEQIERLKAGSKPIAVKEETLKDRRAALQYWEGRREELLELI